MIYSGPVTRGEQNRFSACFLYRSLENTSSAIQRGSIERNKLDERTKSRVDVIYDTLRERICLGEYGNGQILYEGELGREFSVSRTPIRQVLQRLAFDRLATVRAGVGTAVTGGDPETLQRSLQIRARIHDLIADLAVVHSEPDIKATAEFVQFKADKLEGSSARAQFWGVYRDLQEMTNRIIDDDLLRNVDEMIFFRTAPALLRAASQDMGPAVSALQGEVGAVAERILADDPVGAFAARSAQAPAYGALLP